MCRGTNQNRRRGSKTKRGRIYFYALWRYLAFFVMAEGRTRDNQVLLCADLI